jgi:hypothetical protein
MSDLSATEDLGHLEAVPSTTAPIPMTEEPAPKKKRRWIGWVIALVVLVALLVAAWIIGDIIARDYAEKYVRDQVVSQFDLEPTAAVDVEIGPGSLIAQALTGKIDSVDVDVADVAVGPITSDIQISMTGIPLSADAPVDTIRADVSIPEDQLSSLTGFITSADVESISLVEDRIAIESSFALFGISVPVGVEVTPVAQDGQVGFTPVTVLINGAEISVEALSSGPFAGLAGTLAQTQTFCVSDSLPEALTITDVAVEDAAIHIDLEADGTALGGSSFTTKGTCD